MITEQEIIDDLFVLSGKLTLLASNRRNNQEFWKDIQNKLNSIVSEITRDKKIYGW